MYCFVFCCFRWDWTNYHKNIIEKCHKYMNLGLATDLLTSKYLQNCVVWAWFRKLLWNEKNLLLFCLENQAHPEIDFYKHLGWNVSCKELFYCQFSSFFLFQTVFSPLSLDHLAWWSASSHLNQKNWRIRYVFGSMSNILHQCMPGLLLLSVFAIIKVYFPSEEIIAAWSINSYNSREKHQQN